MHFYVSAASSQASAPPPAEQMRLRKKSQNLNRSDSTGSSSGRKFLAPTLSDPQAFRSDKHSQKKKSGAFMGASMGGAGAGASGITTTSSTTRTRSQILSSDHGRSKGHVLRPELTTESEEYEDVAGPSTSYGATGAISKHTLPPLPAESSGVHFHASTSQSMHGFDLQTSPYDGGGAGGTSSTNVGATAGSATGIGITGRSSTFNNNSSSTGSNIAASTSKVSGAAGGGNTMGASSSNTNVAYEVHDWWTDQVNYESSDEDDEE